MSELEVDPELENLDPEIEGDNEPEEPKKREKKHECPECPGGSPPWMATFARRERRRA